MVANQPRSQRPHNQNALIQPLETHLSQTSPQPPMDPPPKNPMRKPLSLRLASLHKTILQPEQIQIKYHDIHQSQPDHSRESVENAESFPGDGCEWRWQD